jgi:hypothetical protein
MAADSPIHIPDYVVMFDPESKNQMRDLAEVLVHLLERAEGLTGPVHSCLSTICREITLLFEGTQETFKVMADWSERFGGTVTARPGTDSDGAALVVCELRFAYLGASLEAHAYIKPPVTG